MRRHPLIALGLVLFNVLACSGLGAAERSPVGVWSVAPAKDKGAAGTANAEPVLRVRFDEDGTYTIRRGDAVIVEGIYDVFEDELLLTDVAGPESCAQADQAMATYRWKLQRSRLVLTRVDDDCKSRAGVFAAGPLARAKEDA